MITHNHRQPKSRQTRLTLGLYAQASSDADQDAAYRIGARFMPSPRDSRGMERHCDG